MCLFVQQAISCARPGIDSGREDDGLGPMTPTARTSKPRASVVGLRTM